MTNTELETNSNNTYKTALNQALKSNDKDSIKIILSEKNEQVIEKTLSEIDTKPAEQNFSSTKHINAIKSDKKANFQEMTNVNQVNQVNAIHSFVAFHAIT